MLASLVEALRSAGLEFSSRDLQDILLLARRLDAPAGAAPQPNVTPAAPADEMAMRQDPPPASEEDLPATPQQPQSAADPAAEQVRLHSGADTGHIPGKTLLLRGVAPLNATADYRRSLYPFMRRVPTPRCEILDEELTATHFVDTGVWMPSYRPATERWFDVTLLIEDTPSVDVWQEALELLAQTFRNQSGMRSVSLYRLVTGVQPHLVSLPSGAVHEFEHLQRGGVRQLIIFATDGTSADWRDGRMYNLLAPLAAVSQVSIMQLLPQRTWRHTALGEPLIQLQVEYPGQPSSALRAQVPWWLDCDAAGRALRLPALSMRVPDLAAWAQAIHARGSALMPGWLVPASGGEGTTGSATPAQPCEYIATYQHTVSPQAYDLAVFLSAVDPLTVPVMRLVMRAMLPAAGNDVLAEFLVGGLLEQLSPASVPRDEREYRFRPGLREQLAGALRISEDRRIKQQLQAVGRVIAEQTGTGGTLKVRFASPDGHPRLSEWTLPFAEVSLRALAPTRAAQAGPTAVPTTMKAESPPSRSVKVGEPLRILHLSDLHFGAEGTRRTPDPTAVPTAMKAELPPSRSVKVGESLRIFNLSDLHFGAEDTRGTPDRPEFGPAWDENLRELRADGAIDLICISGDLTWTGKPDHFEQLSIFLDRTLSTLGLDRSRICAVPGNHDTERDFPRLSASLAAQHEDINRNYMRWASTYLRRRYRKGATNVDYCVRFAHHGSQVQVLEWDSAWRMRDHSSSSEALGALERLLTETEDVAPASMSIVISHVPLSAMVEREKVERLFQKMGVQLFAQSHFHPEEECGWQMAGTLPTLVSWVGGTASRGRTAGNMQLVTYMVNGSKSVPASCLPRQWSPASGRWVPGEAARWPQSVLEQFSISDGEPLEATPADSSAAFLAHAHNYEVAEAAFEATRQAWYGNRRAGVVAQDVAMSLNRTLLHYLDRCYCSLPSPYYLILTDRVSIAKQLARVMRGEPAFPSPVIVPESAEHLERVLDGRGPPCIVITTVQKLKLTKPRWMTECVVVYFAMRSSVLRYMEKFPNGTLIVFAPFPQLIDLNKESLGSPITAARPLQHQPSYPIHVELAADQKGFLRRGQRNMHMVEQLAGFIMSDRGRRATDGATTFVVVPNAASAELMSKELQWPDFADGNIVNVATKAGQHAWFRYRANAVSGPICFVVTSNHIAGGRFEAPGLCYICCPLPAAAQAHLLFSLVRRRNESPVPVLVDLVGIDWGTVASSLML